MTKLARALATLLLATVSIPSVAQTARVRGEIEKFDHSVLTVKAQDSAIIDIKLDNDAAITAMTKASLADIATGSFIGTAAHPGGPNGELVALEVHVFAESMRGTGEGHRPMTQGHTMTNATVENVVTAMNNRILTLRYNGGEQHIQIPDGIPIVMLSPSDRNALKTGEHVSFKATKQPDGTITAARITVGVDGVIPPL
ncbi:MAG TPA: hypothetical protein VIR04_02895 [Paralcaligenes sp.]